jgi:hypothetical protein
VVWGHTTCEVRRLRQVGSTPAIGIELTMASTKRFGWYVQFAAPDFVRHLPGGLL